MDDSNGWIVKCLFGDGLDASRESHLPGVRHVYKAANNLYSLAPEAEQNSLDFIYSKDTVNLNKFPIVVLTEQMKSQRKEA
jgi:hypothetical protein